MSKYKGVKKTLAVFMAALMVLSCWVFTPISFEAEAAEAGQYYYKIVINCTDEGEDADGESTWTNYAWRLYGQYDYGSGAENAKPNDLSNPLYKEYRMRTKEEFTLMEGYGEQGWFPTRLEPDLATKNTGFLGASSHKFVFDVKVYIGSSADNLTLVYSVAPMGTTSQPSFNIPLKFSGKPETYSLPSPKDVKLTNAASATLTIPKVRESATTVDCSAAIYDQYGVQMTNYTPTSYYVTSAQPTTAPTASDVTGASIDSSGKLTVNSDALMDGDIDTKTIYAVAVYGDKFAYKAVTLNDPDITFKFNDDKGGVTSPSGTVTKKYGHTLGYEPTGTLEGYTFNGFYLDNGTQLTTDTRFEDDLTWTAKWTINQYKAKFQYRNKTTGETETYDTNNYVNYGSGVSVPAANMPNYGTDFTIGDNHYTLTGWTLDGNTVTFPTTMPAKDPTYVAVYNDEFLKADLTALKEQIARADEAKTDEYYTQKGYTDEYILALDTAYNTAASLNKDTTGKSQQGAVDTATESLKAILDSPKVKDVTVIFKDETGSVLKDGYATVKWGESVTVPENPSIDNDLSNHYNFKGWLGATSDDVAAFCAKVTEDKIFLADFEAEAHAWSDKMIPSTCTSDGVIEYTCTKCNYTYTSDTDDKAHHTWTTDKVVVKAATCHSEGIKATQCTVCKVYQDGSIESIAKLDHVYGEWTDYVEATCTGMGVQVKSCTNNGCEAKEYQTTAAKEHNWGSKTVVKSTCTTAGYTRETCENCGLIRYTAGDAATGHNTTTETVAATCTADGYTRTYCTKCKVEIGDGTTLQKTDHSFGEWTDIVKVTCGQTGVQYHECSACKQIEYKTVAKLTEHQYKDVVTAPTCTAQGYTTHTCEVCGKVDVDTYTNILDHDMEKVDEESQAATCMTPSITVEKCSRCEYKTVTVGDDTKGHDFREVADKSQAATCGQSGYKTMKCANCDLEYKEYTDAATGEHNWTFTTSQAGTQLTVKGECSYCKAKTETNVTVAEGHTYSSVSVTKQPTCKDTGTIVIACDKEHNADCTATVEATLPTNPDAHKNITTATTSATCTTTGTAVTTCNDCNATIAETTIPETGHSYTTKLSEILATCKTAGSVTLKCANCNSTTTIKTDTNPNAHKYKKTSSVGATCTTPAYDVYACENGCGETYNMYTGGVANGHTWGTPTVTQNGNLVTVTRTCTVENCNATDTLNITVDYRHNFNGTVENIKDATCKEAGQIKVYCADEGCTESVTIDVPLNSKAHSNIKTDYQKPDCLNDGYVKTYCDDCKNELVTTTTIDKLGHDFSVAGNITTAASCTTDGKQTYTCSRCDATTEVTIPKLGHNYETTETHNATCTTYGYYVKECKNANCDATYNELIKELGHTLTGDKEKIAPTCTEQGYDKQYCEACGEWIKSNYVKAKDHNFDGGTVVTSPTCKAGGYTTYTCKNDGCTYSYVGDYTPASSHDYTGENSVVVTPPTCTDKGYTTHKCKNCEYYFIDTYVDAIGHDFDKTKGEAGTDAETGKSYTKYPCKHECGEYQYEYVGDGCTHANWEYVKTIAPTCINDGYDIYSCPTCKDNEIKTNIKPALGHVWDYWTIITYPTETSNGLQERKCKNCTEKDTEEIVYGKYYLVTFYNHDGTRLIRPAYYSYGKAAKMPDFTPTRVADTGYTYTFKGYNYTNGEINCVTKRMAVMAEYEAHERSYAVTYKNEDGTVLQTVSSVKYTNITSAYTAGTPTKASDEYYTYTFNSWSVNYNTDDGTAVATATYTQKLTDENVTPDGNKPGLFTKFIAWLKTFLKKYFGIEL